MVYLDLWFRAFNGLVDIRSEREVAYSCGFTKDRGIRSWRERILELEKQGFVRIGKRCDSIGHIFLVDPDMVVQRLERAGVLNESWKNEYEIRMKDIGAKRWMPPTGGKKIKVLAKNRMVIPRIRPVDVMAQVN